MLKRSTLGVTVPELLPGNRFGIVPGPFDLGFRRIQRRATESRRTTASSSGATISAKSWGTHSLKMGAHITRSRTDENIRFNDQGAVTFTTSARLTTRNVVGDVLLGNFQNYTESGADADYWGRFNEVDCYFQDSWKVSRRLTVEMGVRYNYIPPFYNAAGQHLDIRAGACSIRQKRRRCSPADGSITPGHGRSLQRPGVLRLVFPGQGKRPHSGGERSSPAASVRGTLARRLRDESWRTSVRAFGFAYDPFGRGKTSVRGGFGIFYDRTPTNALINPSGNPPFNVTSSIFDGNIDNPSGGTERDFPVEPDDAAAQSFEDPERDFLQLRHAAAGAAAT